MRGIGRHARVEIRCLLQDLSLEGLESWSEFKSELFSEVNPRTLVDLQRVGLAPERYSAVMSCPARRSRVG